MSIITHRVRYRYFTKAEEGMKKVDDMIIAVSSDESPQLVYNAFINKAELSFGQPGQEAYMVTLVNAGSGIIEKGKTIQ